MKSKLIFVVFILFSTAIYSEVRVNIIDTGAGLATVISLPDDHFIIYDTGHWNEIDLVLDRVIELLPEDAAIDIVVLSHTDSDHIGVLGIFRPKKT